MKVIWRKSRMTFFIVVDFFPIFAIMRIIVVFILLLLGIGNGNGNPTPISVYNIRLHESQIRLADSL